MNNFLENPFTQMGLSILAANRPGTNAGQAIGIGGLNAFDNLQRLQTSKEQSEARKMQAELTKNEIERIKADAAMQADMQRRAQEYVAQNPQYTDLYTMGGREAVLGAMSPKLPTGMRMGPNGPEIIPEWEDFAMRKAAAGATRVDAGTRMESKFEETVGKGYGELHMETIKNSDKAANSQYKVEAMKGLLDLWKKSGGSPGALAEVETQTKALAKSFGIDLTSLSEVGPAQAILSVGNQLVLANIGGEGGMPANNFSDADRKFVTSTVPQLTDDEDSFLLKLEVQSRMNKRSMEKEDFMANNDHLKPVELRKAWRKYVETNPLFDDLKDWKNPYKGQSGLQIDQQSLEAELRRRGL